MKYFLILVSLCIVASFIVLSIPLYLGFFLAAFINFIYYILIEKYSIKELINYYLKGALEHKIIYIIIILIGGLVSVWISSGIVPSLMYYGFKYIDINHIFLLSFVFTSIVSIFMGTALGTISTVGIGIMGIGAGFGVDLNILLGAIVSGSFIADKVSPISGLNNLLILITETNYKDLMKEMIKTFLPVYVISLLFFMVIDYIQIIDFEKVNNIEKYKYLLSENFYISPFLLIIPLIVILLPFLKVPTKYTLFIGLLLGSSVTIFIQNQTLNNAFKIIYKGFHLEEKTLLSKILNSGGIHSMIEVILIVMGVLSFIGLLDGVGILDELSKKIVSGIKDKKSLILKTGLISGLFTIITCDQTVGIIMPSKLFVEKYKKFNLNNEVLARVISDTGIVIAPLMPWNVNVIIFSSVLGIYSMKFALYSILCYLFPIFTIITAKFIKKNH